MKYVTFILPSGQSSKMNFFFVLKFASDSYKPVINLAINPITIPLS